MIVSVAQSEEYNLEEIEVQAHPQQSVELADVHMPRGLIGFENRTRFSLEMIEQGPLHILSPTPEDDIFFYLINPYVVRKDYVLDIFEEDFKFLKEPAASDTVVFSIVTMSGAMDKITCNLLGPIVINLKEKLACQCVNNGRQWTTKHTLFDGAPVVPVA